MQKTVYELILMYENAAGTVPAGLRKNVTGKLHTDITTQRGFIYNNITTVDEEENEITKAGYLIQSILEKKIQLPALYFWNVQDDEKNIHYSDDEFNLHDGKQRFLSIYNFIKGNVITRLNGVELAFNDITLDQQQYLLDYTFDIVVRTGTCKEEEQSFFLINTTGEPLTHYEGLRGAYYGTWITEFENYINNLQLDNIHKVGRGEQAGILLYLALGIIQDDKKLLLLNAKRLLEEKRNSSFNRTDHDFEEKLKLYNEYVQAMHIKNGEEKDKLKIAKIVDYIICHKYDKDKIISYYKRGFESSNDISKWKFDTHKKAIDNYMKGITCDYRRYFNNTEKSILFSKSPVCGKCGKSFSYNELEVDHIKPWSDGGVTDVTQNAQLLCKSCNCQKGANQP